MPAFTALGFPYPLPADPDNAPSDIQSLAAAIDVYIQNTMGAWTSFTPTWTGVTTNPVLGNGTIVGRYNKIGKVFAFYILLTMGGTTTFGTGAWQFTLPFTAANATVVFAGALDSSASTRYNGQAVIATAAPAISGIFSNASATAWTNNQPITWASGDILYINGTIETTA